MWVFGIIVILKLSRPLICFFLTGSVWTLYPVFFFKYNFQKCIFSYPLYGIRYWSGSIALASCHFLTLMAVLRLYEIMVGKTLPESNPCLRIELLFQPEVLLGLSSSNLFSYCLESICIQLSNPSRPGLLFPISSFGTSANSFLCSSLLFFNF